MTALEQDRNTPERVVIPNLALNEFELDEDVVLFVGGIACMNGDGYVVAGETATGLIPVGVVQRFADNTGGDAGDVRGKAKPGVFRFVNDGDAIVAADKGSVCYIVDDQTVDIDDGGATRSKAGVIVDVDADGVWVAVGFAFFSNPAATPAGTLQKKTVTVPFDHASFAAESDDGDAVNINVGTALPAGAILVGARYTITDPFVGAGLATLTMIVGKSGDTNGVIEAVDILGDTAGQYQGTLGTMMVNGPSLQSEVQLVANFDPDGSAALDELTAGEVVIDVYYFVAF